MIEFFLLIALVFIFTITYIVSVYSLAVYIDPDEIEQLFPNASDSRRAFLTRLADDPRAFTQIAIVFKSMALIVCTLISFELMTGIGAWFNVGHSAIFTVGLSLLWIAYMIVAEYMPRRVSRHVINERMLKHLWVISSLYFLLSPIVAIYRRALSGASPDSRVTEEEKEGIVERAIETLAEEAGIGETIVEEDEKEMIGQIFQLDQTVVREIMIPRMDIVGIESGSSLQEISDLVRRDGHSRYPVYKGTIDEIVGMAYIKDIFSNMPADKDSFSISEFLRKPYLIPETKIIGELLGEFKNKHIHVALVMDEYGGLAGLVTLEDIIEEIFGEIQDEHDVEGAEISETMDGRLLVNATIMLEELQEYLGTEFEQGEYDTVGGLIYDLVGSVPAKGQVVRWHSLEFEIDQVEGQRIRFVRIRK